LIPAIEDLMAQAQLRYAELDAIVFGQGPGSFTGLRTACSVAQGLAFGTAASPLRSQAVPVLPVDTLLAVAEDARWQFAKDLVDLEITAFRDARMNQLYAAKYQFNSGLWMQIKACELISPSEAMQWQNPTNTSAPPVHAYAGNVFDVHALALPSLPASACWRALPSAAALLRLAPALLAAGAGVAAHLALPLYVRDKVAQTTQERAAVKAGAQAL
jgi:tRNA threonylcarbamoyladenosine biosynthesis protein TsaB